MRKRFAASSALPILSKISFLYLNPFLLAISSAVFPLYKPYRHLLVIRPNVVAPASPILFFLILFRFIMENFEKETYTLINIEKQIKLENREKEGNIEMF